MNLKNHIPNLFTSLNLATGCLAIIAVFEESLENIIYYILVAGIFDFLDGFAARILKATSPIGRDLDSLADMVTFGVVPSLVMFVLIRNSSSNDFTPYLAILIAVFSGLRLAKFNNDERQSDTFYGLPTPANAILLGSIPLLIESNLPMEWLKNEYILLTLTVIICILLISDVKLIALKFKGCSWKNNELRYTLILISLILLILFGMVALPLIILVYVVLSLSSNLLLKI